MPTIGLTTEIRAPVERCFDLSRSIDLHVASATATREQAIAGVTRGLIDLGEQVTWRARHFGVVWYLTSRITAMDRPHYFQDRMVRGPFARFEHDHYFRHVGAMTQLRDELRFECPLGRLGRLASAFVVGPHLERFLAERNALLKSVAEGESTWQQYIGA